MVVEEVTERWDSLCNVCSKVQMKEVLLTVVVPVVTKGNDLIKS